MQNDEIEIARIRTCAQISLRLQVKIDLGLEWLTTELAPVDTTEEFTLLPSVW